MTCFGFVKPKKIVDGWDVENYLEWFYGEEKETKGRVRSIDTRHVIIWSEHTVYVTVLYKKGVILEPQDLPPERLGKFVRHISTNDDGLLEVNYYD